MSVVSKQVSYLHNSESVCSVWTQDNTEMTSGLHSSTLGELVGVCC